MKKLIATLAIAAGAIASSQAQGFITFASGGQTIFTNSSPGGVTNGVMSATTGTPTYYFALFYSASATTVNGSAAAVMPTGGSAGNYVFNDGAWTFDNPSSTAGYLGPAYATNNLTAGRFTSAVTDPANSSQTLLPFTTAAQFVVLGWSANIGTTLAQVISWYNGGNPLTAGWIGESAVSGAITPSAGGVTPAQSLFGPAAPQLQRFSLGLVPTPEPSTMALAGLGGLSLLLFRRRK